MGFLKRVISELNTLPADTPVQRFKCSLTTALTWLGARVVRYSFPVRLSHSLLRAGLSRRCRRGRDSDYSLPPARTRACAASAHGSYLGYLACLASKRTLG